MLNLLTFIGSMKMRYILTGVPNAGLPNDVLPNPGWVVVAVLPKLNGVLLPLPKAGLAELNIVSENMNELKINFLKKLGWRLFMHNFYFVYNLNIKPFSAKYLEFVL